MAAKDTDFNEATEPMEEEFPELDQPDEDSYMSLEQVLNGDADADDAEENGELEQQAQANPESADRKGEKPQDGFRTQADFDKAWGQRQAAMRKQWERENAEAFEIAETVRRRYQGKTAADIREAMILEEARELAMDTGYSEEEAVKKVRARHAYDERANATEEVDEKTLQFVAKQLDEYAKKGIDLQDEIEKDQELLKFIGENGDLSGVMIEVMARRLSGNQPTDKPVAQPNRKAAPKPEISGAARSASVARKYTEAEWDAIDKAVASGKHVRLPG